MIYYLYNNSKLVFMKNIYKYINNRNICFFVNKFKLLTNSFKSDHHHRHRNFLLLHLLLTLLVE